MSVQSKATGASFESTIANLLFPSTTKRVPFPSLLESLLSATPLPELPEILVSVWVPPIVTLYKVTASSDQIPPPSRS